MTNEAKTEQTQQLSASELADVLVSSTPPNFIALVVDTIKMLSGDGADRANVQSAAALEQAYIKQYGCSMYDHFPFTQVAGVH